MPEKFSDGGKMKKARIVSRAKRTFCEGDIQVKKSNNPIAQQMAILYNDGMTMEEIGKKFDVTRQYVQLLIKNIVNTKEVRAKRHEQKLRIITKDVIHDYNAEARLSDIYEKYKIRASDLEHILNENDVPRRQQLSPERIHWIIEQYKKGLGYSAIARQIGTHPANAKRVLISHGIKIRKPGRVAELN